MDDNEEESQDDGADQPFFDTHDGPLSTSTSEICRSIFVANQAREHHTIFPTNPKVG
jgi:hypothetical protein